MATYAIGDIQGCFQTFERLIAQIKFDPSRDKLWLAGDLVNRGPQSTEVLRWVYAHRKHIQVVLGNHDLHFLARAAGVTRKKKRDTFDALLEASDRDLLADWLRKQPLLYREGNTVLVHAGLLPSWDIEEAERRAKVVEQQLTGPNYATFLRQMRPPYEPEAAYKEANESAAIFTRMRMLDPEGIPDFSYDGPPDEAPEGLVPWFRIENRKTAQLTVVFGHWAALGLFVEENLLGLDSGCVWGQKLTALRLEDRALFQEPFTGS